MSGSITANGITISFLISQTPKGFLEDRPQPVAEELTTPGADGARFRTIYLQYPEFDMVTITEASTHNAAVQDKRDIERNMVQKQATVNAYIGGVNYTMKNVQVLAASAEIIPGPVHGAGASGTTAAHVRATWRLKGGDFSNGLR